MPYLVTDLEYEDISADSSAAARSLFANRVLVCLHPTRTHSDTNRLDMASPRNNTESSPLLTPPRTDSPHPERTAFSSLLSNNLFGGPGAWVAQAGLVIFVLTLWKVLYEHPAGELPSLARMRSRMGRADCCFCRLRTFRLCR